VGRQVGVSDDERQTGVVEMVEVGAVGRVASEPQRTRAAACLALGAGIG
jgi:hypothetical protein